MYHAVWKLAALAVVVAVCVGVVVWAQHGMHDNDLLPENEPAVTSLGEGNEQPADVAAEPTETAAPPSQDEPELADAGLATAPVPAAEKMRRPADAAATIDSPAGSTSLNGTESDTSLADEGARSSIQKAAALERDPFDDAEDDEDEPPNRPADASRTPGKDGPQLIEATDDGPARPQRRPVADDPFPDDEPPAASRAGGDSTREDGPADAAADESVVAPAPALPADKKASRIAPSPSAGDAVDDDEELLRLPVEENRTPPKPTKEVDGPPARLGLTIEPDEADDTARDQPSRDDLKREERPTVPAQMGRDPALQAERESAPREPPAFPDAPAPAAVAQPSAETPADEPPSVPKPQLPEVTIEKVAPATAVLGRPMVYHILVRNAGDIPAQKVVVEDIVPPGVAIDGTIPQAQLKENHLIWKLGTLAPGREKKISVRVIPQAEGTVGSVATVSFSPETHPVSSATAPQIKFEVEAPRKAAVGMPVEFRFRVRNIGPIPATGVTIRDVLPAGLRHNDGDDLEYEIGQIAAGRSREVKLTLVAAQTGPTINRVVVTADGNVSEEADVPLEVVGPTLAVVRSGPKRLFPEKTGRYTNTVSNPGGSPISGATVVEVVPAGMEFVEAADGGEYDARKRTVTWKLNQLFAGESKTVNLTLRAAGRGSQISVVRASDGAGASGETVGTTHVAGVPRLTIEIGELAALVETGETIKVPFRILNRGSDVAANVRAAIAIPSNLQFVSALGPVDHRKVQTPGEPGSPTAMEVQYAPITGIEPRGDAVFELTFKARAAGTARIQVQAGCDELSEPIRREEVTTVVVREQQPH